MSDTILKCIDLNKKFGKKQILKNVSFEIKAGDIFAFIGPNGSGKTTTIKCILGLNTINSGDVIINGYSIKNNFKNAIKRVGAIVENPDLYMQLSGYENLILFKNMYNDLTTEDIKRVVSLVGLDNRIKDKVSKYSLGMRQRLGIAQALLHKPNILILDEPTNGLDPEGIKDLRTLLKKIAKQDKIGIFISSHNLSELENFCNKVCIIKNGKVVETTTINKIKKGLNTKYIFEVDSTTKLATVLKNKIEIISKDAFTINIERDKVAQINEQLVKNKIKVFGIKEEEISLEEVFLQKTGGNMID